MPNEKEVAQLIVQGNEFHDWESVFVQLRWQDAYPIFRFTAAEGKDLPLLYTDLQFKPGDQCEIKLGGQLAITGLITQRQVAYAATEHGVQLSGVGRQWAGATSSVPSEKGQNTFDDQNAESIFKKVCASVATMSKVIGKVDQKKFEVMQSQPGELVWDFLDRVARMANATLGSDHLGNLLMIGEHSSPIVQELTEGFNILKMQCLFSSEALYSIYKLTGQFRVKDEKTQRQSAEIVAKALGGLKGAQRWKEFVTEHPVKSPEWLQMRANYEALQSDGTQIRANVTVQGWLRDGSNLWIPGDNVQINSPMCPLNLIMKIQTATFTQDNKGGTTTLLECVLPWMLGDKAYALNMPREGTQNSTAATRASNIGDLTMHRMNPLQQGFVGYTSSGARALVDEISDNPMMQEMKGSFLSGENRKGIESPQNYGFTSVVMPATKGKDGKIEECAEAYINFLGGNRSFPVAAVMDDRRYRLKELKPGDVAMFDHHQHQMHFNKDGIFITGRTDKKMKIQLADPPQDQQQGSGKSVEALAGDGSSSGSTSSGGGRKKGQKQRYEKESKQHLEITKDKTDLVHDQTVNYKTPLHSFQPGSGGSARSGGPLVQIFGDKFTGGLGHFLKQVTAAPPTEAKRLTTKGYVNSIFAALGIPMPPLPPLPIPPLPPGIEVPPGITLPPIPAPTRAFVAPPGLKLFEVMQAKIAELERRVAEMERKAR